MNQLIKIILFWVLFLSALASAHRRGGFEYAPFEFDYSSAILKVNLLQQDFKHRVLLLSNNQESNVDLSYRENVSLIFVSMGDEPVRISLSSCSGYVHWNLYWRPMVYTTGGLTQGIRFSSHYFGNRSTDEAKGHENSSSKSDSSSLKKRKFGSLTIYKDNFTVPHIRGSPRYLYQYDRDPVLQYQVSHGDGKEPLVYYDRKPQSGLYVITAMSISKTSKFHVLATKSPIKPKIRVEFSQFYKKQITMSWDEKPSKEYFCLAISSQKLYSSLCSAKKFQRSMKSLPTPMLDNSLILGCTKNMYYTFPVIPGTAYFISTWQSDDIIPSSRQQLTTKLHRGKYKLITGVVHTYILSYGKPITPFYKIKKKSKLYLVIISCRGAIGISVSHGNKTVQENISKQIYFQKINIESGILRINLSSNSNFPRFKRIKVSISRSRKRLPIPKLPKNRNVSVQPINCSSVVVKWRRSPGKNNYCVFFYKYHKNASRINVLQCGWNKVINYSLNHNLKCLTNSSSKKEIKVILNLPKEDTFRIHVLVRHAISEFTLSLNPSFVALPKCTL